MRYVFDPELNPKLLAELSALYVSVNWPGRSAESLARVYANSQQLLVAYQSKEQVVGLVRAAGDGITNLMIYDLIVHPRLQGQGIGKELLRRICEAFPDVGRVSLLAAPGKEDFYRKQGWLPGMLAFDWPGAAGYRTRPHLAAPPRIEPTQEEHLTQVIAWEQNPANKPYIRPYTHAQHTEAIRGDREYHFMVYGHDEPAGFIILVRHQEPQGLAIEFKRLVIAKPGQGLGRFTINWVKEYAFRNLGAQRLWLEVFDTNSRALSLYAAAGFQPVRLSPHESGKGQILEMECRY